MQYCIRSISLMWIIATTLRMVWSARRVTDMPALLASWLRVLLYFIDFLLIVGRLFNWTE